VAIWRCVEGEKRCLWARGSRWSRSDLADFDEPLLSTAPVLDTHGGLSAPPLPDELSEAAYAAVALPAPARMRSAALRGLP